MCSFDRLNLTACRWKLPEMMYKPIIAPFLVKRTRFASGAAAVRLEPGLECLISSITISIPFTVFRAD